MPPDAGLLVTERARAVRRRLPTAAWVVLEELTLDALAGEVTTSVRSLADSLGLSKDTVARAMRRLLDEQLVVRVDGRDATGRFDRTVYRVDLAAAGLATPVDQPDHATIARPSTPPTPTVPRTPRSRFTPPSADAEQLPLFDHDPHPSPPLHPAPTPQPPSTDALAPEVPGPSRSPRAPRPKGSSC